MCSLPAACSLLAHYAALYRFMSITKLVVSTEIHFQSCLVCFSLGLKCIHAGIMKLTTFASLYALGNADQLFQSSYQRAYLFNTHFIQNNSCRAALLFDPEETEVIDCLALPV